MTRERAKEIMDKVIYDNMDTMPVMKDGKDATRVGRMIGRIEMQLEIELEKEIEEDDDEDADFGY